MINFLGLIIFLFILSMFTKLGKILDKKKSETSNDAGFEVFYQNDINKT